MSAHDENFLSPKAVTALTSLSRQTIWRMAKSGKFPAPRQLSVKRIGYPEKQVNE